MGEACEHVAMVSTKMICRRKSHVAAAIINGRSFRLTDGRETGLRASCRRVRPERPGGSAGLRS
jgi:hypothetical protein